MIHIVMSLFCSSWFASGYLAMCLFYERGIRKIEEEPWTETPSKRVCCFMESCLIGLSGIVGFVIIVYLYLEDE